MAPSNKLKRKRPMHDELADKSSISGRRAPHFSAPNEMVTFLIGKAGSEEPFSVHKEFACYYSPVLKAAFDSSFIEGQTQIYRLEDVNSIAFRLFVQWLYSQKIDLYVDVNSTADASNHEHRQESIQNDSENGNETIFQKARIHAVPVPLIKAWRDQDLDLAQLWVIGDRLLIPRLQNAVMMAWHSLWTDPDTDRHCSTKWVRYAYEHTCEGSPLRNLAVDQLMYSVNEAVIGERAKKSKELPYDLLYDIVIAYNRAVQVVNARDFDNERSPDSSSNDSDDSDDSASDADDSASDNSNDLTSEYEGYADIQANEGPEGPLSMVSERFRYRCTRAWRGYLVLVDVRN